MRKPVAKFKVGTEATFGIQGRIVACSVTEGNTFTYTVRVKDSFTEIEVKQTSMEVK